MSGAGWSLVPRKTPAWSRKISAGKMASVAASTVNSRPSAGPPASHSAPAQTDAWPQDRLTAGVVIAGHAFVQNLRHGYSEIGLWALPTTRLAEAFTELARAI